MLSERLIYAPVDHKSMNVAVFASGGGNNLLTAIKTAETSGGKIRVRLVVTDRLKIPAIDIAKKNKIPVIARDFEKECGVWSQCRGDLQKEEEYHRAAQNFHNKILDQILRLQNNLGEPIDLIVLSYHRLIRGRLLVYFDRKIINQHPGDLTVMREDNPKHRKYVGLSPVYDALRDGNSKTRTTNFLIREGCDNGEILCSGPWVTYKGDVPVTRKLALEHEIKQKELSDRPCLSFVLTGISEGRFGIDPSASHPDGLNVITYNGTRLPYKGVDLSDK